MTKIATAKEQSGCAFKIEGDNMTVSYAWELTRLFPPLGMETVSHG